MTIWVCIVSGFLQKKFGPKKILMVACFPYFLAWLCVGFATSLPWIYISRLLVGISHAFVTTTVYTTEVSSRDMRGTFSMLESVLRYIILQDALTILLHLVLITLPLIEVSLIVYIDYFTRFNTL